MKAKYGLRSYKANKNPTFLRKSKKIIKTQAVIKKLSLQRFSSLTLISTKDLGSSANLLKALKRI